jgi:hypothetical protein
MQDVSTPGGISASTSLERGLRLASIVLSGAFILLFLYVALRRLHYPFELDRMESAMMTSIWRLAHGLPLYSKPSLEWVAFLYAPFYFYCSAFVAKFVGLTYTAPRIVSILAAFGSFAVIYRMVHRETGRLDAALIAAGFFASFYGLVFGWYDIGRVDMLSVFFLLLAIYCTRYHHPLVAAVIWLLAFQTKQTVLPIAILVFLTGWQRPRRMVTGLIATCALVFGSIYALNRVFHGWYDYYLFGTVSNIAFSPRMAALYIPIDLLRPCGIAIAFVLLAVFVQRPQRSSPALWFYGILTFVITASTGFVRAHEGANVNALIPVYAWISILFGLSIHRLLRWIDQNLPGDTARYAPTLLWFLILVQLCSHVYQPGIYLPSRNELDYRNRYLNALRATPGDVWALNHSFDNILAGKPIHPEMDAFDAVLGRASKTNSEPDAMQDKRNSAAQDLLNAYRSQQFTAIVFDHPADVYRPPWAFTGPTFTAHYPLRSVAIGSDQANVIDQPVVVYFSCSALQTPQIVRNLSTSFVDSSHCP